MFLLVNKFMLSLFFLSLFDYILYARFVQENSMGSMARELLSFLRMIMGYENHVTLLNVKLAYTVVHGVYLTILDLFKCQQILVHNGSHLASTYCALAILKIIGYNFSDIDSESISSSMRSLQQPDGRYVCGFCNISNFVWN